MTLQQHGNAACRSCTVLETSITNSIFSSSVGSTRKAALSRRVEGKLGIHAVVWCFASLRQERSFRKSWHILIFWKNVLS